MTDRSPDDRRRLGRRPTTGVPGWVKVFALVAVLVVVGFAVLHLTGNSLGGPGSHGAP